MRLWPRGLHESCRFEAGWATDVGCVRSRNEDSVLPPSTVPVPGDGEVLLAAVADGVGGMQDGDRASRAAVDTLLASFRPESQSDIGSALLKAASVCQDAVELLNGGRSADEQAATTLVVAALHGATAYVGHVGDSRAYLLRDGRLRQLTHDHSVVAEAVAAREMTAAEARQSPARNLLTRGLGTANGTTDLSPEIRIKPGDRLLLCSDGLHGVVERHVLEQMLRADEPAQGLAGRCLQRALDAGAPDNVSVIVIRVQRGVGGS